MTNTDASNDLLTINNRPQRCLGGIVNVVNVWVTPPAPRPSGEELQKLRWRQGRRVGRTIYAEIGDQPSEADPLIGVMDSPGLAESVVISHNAQLR